MPVFDNSENPIATRTMSRQVCYTPNEVKQIRQLSTLSVTKESHRVADRERVLRLPLTVAANGANFVIIQPQESP